MRSRSASAGSARWSFARKETRADWSLPCSLRWPSCFRICRPTDFRASRPSTRRGSARGRSGPDCLRPLLCWRCCSPALGLYAIIAFGVRQRELEFGIRRALGAQPSDLLRMVLSRGCALTLIGIAAGAVAGLWIGRWVAPLLFEGISPRDPLALAAAVLVLVTAALAASLVPARRAARADPRHALQAE